MFDIHFLISNNSYARLIKPEPKPSEFRKDIPTKIKKPTRKVTPEVLTPKNPTNKKNKPMKTSKKKLKDKKNKVEENNEKFLVSNEIIPLKKPLDLGILKNKSSILSSKDFLIAQKTFSLVKRKRWNSTIKKSENQGQNF